MHTRTCRRSHRARPCKSQERERSSPRGVRRYTHRCEVQIGGTIGQMVAKGWRRKVRTPSGNDAATVKGKRRVQKKGSREEPANERNDVLARTPCDACWTCSFIQSASRDAYRPTQGLREENRPWSSTLAPSVAWRWESVSVCSITKGDPLRPSAPGPGSPS